MLFRSKEKYLNLFDGTKTALKDSGYKLKDISPQVQFYYSYLSNDTTNIQTLCNTLLANYPPSHINYIYACEWYAVLSTIRNDQYTKAYYLAKGAIACQRKSMKNNSITYRLAKLLFELNDISHAHRYIKEVQRNANISNSRLHKTRASELLEIISNTHEKAAHRSQSRLIFFLITICIFFVILIISLIILIRQKKIASSTREELAKSYTQQVELNKKLNLLNAQLKQTNNLKEEYIGIFLGMRPYYIEKLRVYRSQVTKYLRNGKIADLNEYCKSDSFIENEVELSNKEFDKVFLSIFPDFVKEFNNLLQEDARIYPKAGELTIEMRIFALIRLGVKDSVHIARNLHYSVNTIYNYRSRVKNKAIGKREEFENAIIRIGNPNE